MEKQLISLNLNLSLVDKARLYSGKKGKYLSAVLHLTPTTDQYGNNGFIVESVSKEERQAGQRGTILGNARIITPGADNASQAPQQAPHSQPSYTPPAPATAVAYDPADDLPF